jgi:hypothetical protein
MDQRSGMQSRCRSAPEFKIPLILDDRRAFELGGYQVWTGLHSFLEPATGEAIVTESIKLLDQLRTVPQETVP